MSKFPDVLKKVWMMDSSDVCVVGEHLGYDWNAVCNAISKVEFYAQDGDGTMSVERDYDHGNDIINNIMNAIFKQYPEVKEISISN